MPRIDELLHEHSIHSVRSDGSQMIALETEHAQTDSEWEIIVVRKDGHVEIEASFKQLSTYIGTSEDRFDRIEATQKEHTTRFTGVETRLTNIETLLTQILERLPKN